jgi:hypothetical protein
VHGWLLGEWNCGPAAAYLVSSLEARKVARGRQATPPKKKKHFASRRVKLADAKMIFASHGQSTR